MRPFSAGELARMQGTQESAMQDECVIYAYSTGGINDLGLPVEVYTAGSAIACGYDPTATTELLGEAQVGSYDAKVRMAIDTVIHEHDRVAVTKRYGESITPIMHDVAGPAERGPTGLIVRLTLHTDDPT